MVKHRNLVSFIIAALLYSLLFGGYFYWLRNYIVTDQFAQDIAIQLNLQEFIPEVVPDVQEVEEEPEPEPEPLAKEEPVVEEVIPEPVIPKVIPKPEVKKPVPKKKKVKKKKVRTRSATNRNVGVKRQGSGHASASQKNRFLATVRQRINRNKSYPHIAKRRGMQGSVRVKFTILANGHVGNISVSGPKVFHSSARKAVKRAFPISTKHVPVSLPKTVNLTLRYQLR